MNIKYKLALAVQLITGVCGYVSIYYQKMTLALMFTLIMITAMGFYWGMMVVDKSAKR